MSNINNVAFIEKCSGCFACYNICMRNAIEMKISDEGFYVPSIDNTTCSSCGLCLNVCHILNHPSDKSNKVEPKAFISWSLDERIRIAASSGGLYPELARMIMDYGGVVFAVCWGENWLPKHRLIESIDGIYETMGSKYLPSNVGSCYKDILTQINLGRPVLFVGTPCQVAGLKNFINIKLKNPPPNLILIDLICHGVPSISVYRKYIKEIAPIDQIKNINFRDKSTGWSHFSIRIETKSSTIYKAYHFDDQFFLGYLQNLYLADLCYNCPFAGLPRQGDISLGDFWGVPEKYRSEKGVSLVIVNSEKGKEFLDKLICYKKVFVQEVRIEVAAEFNPRLINGKLDIPKQRKIIIDRLCLESWSNIAAKYIKKPNILRRYFRYITNIYKIIRVLL